MNSNIHMVINLSVSFSICFYIVCLSMSCDQVERDSINKTKFEYISGYSDVDIYNFIEFDSILYLFTDNQGVISITEDSDTLIANNYHDLSEKWIYLQVYNDSLFLGNQPGIYYYGEFDGGSLTIDTQKVYKPSHFWLNENDNFYQDDYFTMSECCAGEFGGTLFIQSNFSDSIEYAIQSVCPLQILNKGVRSYYLINDLRHMSGSSSIIKIDSIENIMRVNQDVERYCNYYSEFFEENMDGYDPLIYDSLNNLILGDGNEYIFDSIRMQILNGYLLANNELAILYMSEGKMKYGIIEDGKIKNVKIKYEIANVDWTYAKSIDFTHAKGIFTQDIK